MKNLMLFIIYFLAIFEMQAQKKQAVRFEKSLTFCTNSAPNSTASTIENYVYKTYKTQKGRDRKLNIALVRPVDKLTDKKRPLVIGIHSGGFLDTCFFEPCYTRYSENVLTEYFTPQGLITASIEYRLTNPLDFKPPRISEKVLRESQYKATQDARAAIKFIFDNAEELKVDTENVFLIGTSAGAITVLHTIFLDNEEISEDLLKEFGALEKQQKIRGAISLAGAINDLKYLEGNQKLPLMFVHGSEDRIVPSEKGYYLSMNHLAPVYGGKAVYEELVKKGFAPKGIFNTYGHSLPDRFKPETFRQINEFIRQNSTCQSLPVAVSNQQK